MDLVTQSGYHTRQIDAATSSTDVCSVRSSPSTRTRSAHQMPVVFRLGQDDFGLSPATAAQRMFCRKSAAGFVVEPPPSMINLRKRIERRRKKKIQLNMRDKKWLGDLARAVLFNGRTSIVVDRAWQTGLLVKVRQFCGSVIACFLNFEVGLWQRADSQHFAELS